MKNFGKILKSIRLERGIGIKKLASDIGVSYTYISKLENDKSMPSSDFIKRIADYFNYNSDKLYVSANKLPHDVEEIIRDNPEEAINYLRDMFRR